MSRFGEVSTQQITKNIEKAIPQSTKNTKASIWRQFMEFCQVRNYELSKITSLQKVADILKDWAYNMKKRNGEDYKEYAVKSIWNSTAKMIQEKYFNEYNIKFDPFADITFKEARDARNSKRKELQVIPEKRKVSSVALNKKDIVKMAKLWNIDNPEGLQKRFFHIASYELAWRGEKLQTVKFTILKKKKIKMELQQEDLNTIQYFQRRHRVGRKNWQTANG